MIDELLFRYDLAGTRDEKDQKIERPASRGSASPSRNSTRWSHKSSNGPKLQPLPTAPSDMTSQLNTTDLRSARLRSVSLCNVPAGSPRCQSAPPFDVLATPAARPADSDLPAKRPSPSVIRRLFEYSFRGSEIGRRETFGEPIVDRPDQITGFLELATLNPNAGKLQSRPQLEREPRLLLGHDHRLLQA